MCILHVHVYLRVHCTCTCTLIIILLYSHCVCACVCVCVCSGVQAESEEAVDRQLLPSEPPPRYGAASVCVGDNLLLFRGRVKDSQQWNSNIFHVFDSKTFNYLQMVSMGDMPDGFLGASMCRHRNNIYHYGGMTTSGNYASSLHHLNHDSRLWSKLNTNSGPMPKSDCGFAALQDGNLVCVNGYGKAVDSHVQPEKFVRSTEYSDGRGWCGELHHFNVTSGTLHVHTQYY